MSAFHDL